MTSAGIGARVEGLAVRVDSLGSRLEWHIGNAESRLAALETRSRSDREDFTDLEQELTRATDAIKHLREDMLGDGTPGKPGAITELREQVKSLRTAAYSLVTAITAGAVGIAISVWQFA